MRIFGPAVLLLITTASIEVGSVCQNEAINSTSVITLPPAGAVAGDICNFTITRTGNDSKAFTALTLTDVSMTMGSNDSLLIYDGPVDSNNTNLLMTVTQRTVLSEMAITFNETTLIQFHVAENNTASSGEISIAMEGCSVNLTDQWVLPVVSPTYLLNRGNFFCTYTVANSLPKDRAAVVSFGDCALHGDTFLELTSGNMTEKHTETDMVHKDFFADPEASNTTVKFLVVSSNMTQFFSLTFDSSVKSCTEDLSLPPSGSPVLRDLQLPSSPGAQYSCRMRVTAPQGAAAIMVNVKEATLLGQLDSLVVTEGSEAVGPVADLLTGTTADHVVLSSSSSVSLHLSLSPALLANRSVVLEFTALNKSGRFQDSGAIVATSNASFFQLSATEGQVVKVNVSSSLTPNVTVTFYNGLQTSSPEVIQLSSGNPLPGTVVGGSDMLMVVAGLTGAQTLKANFTSVNAGCDQLLTGTSGHMTIAEPNATGTLKCRWTITPQGKAGVINLDIDSLTLSLGDTVTIFSGLSGSTVVQAFNQTTLTEGRGPLPQVYIPASAGASVLMTFTEDLMPDSEVTLHYDVMAQECGGVLSSEGQLLTPNFPNQYPLNAHCDWAGGFAGARQMYLSVTSLDLAGSHTLALVNHVDNGTDTTLVAYGGSETELPPDFIGTVTNKTSVHFASDPLPGVSPRGQVNKGASLHYRLLECGGSINATSGSIASAGFPGGLNISQTCLWIITVGGNTSLNVINFTLTVNGTKANQTMAKYLTVYDGPSTRALRLPSTAYNGSRPTVARGNTIIVEYIFVYNNATKDTFGFNMTFSTYKCNSTCGNGVCLQPSWVCNNINDCGDNTDELHCSGPGPTPPTTPAPVTPSAIQDYDGYVKSGWVAGCLFIGMLLGAVLLMVVPRVWRKFRGGGGNYSRMADDRPVVA